jgi:hypothetical protein
LYNKERRREATDSCVVLAVPKACFSFTNFIAFAKLCVPKRKAIRFGYFGRYFVADTFSNEQLFNKAPEQSAHSL